MRSGLRSQAADRYYAQMTTRQRLLRVNYGDGGCGLLGYFVLTKEADIPRFHDRPAWSTPQDFVDGSLLYIDTYVGSGFHRGLLPDLEETFNQLVPSWQSAVWFGTGQQADLRHTYSRRR